MLAPRYCRHRPDHYPTNDGKARRASEIQVYRVGHKPRKSPPLGLDSKRLRRPVDMVVLGNGLYHSSCEPQRRRGYQMRLLLYVTTSRVRLQPDGPHMEKDAAFGLQRMLRDTHGKVQPQRAHPYFHSTAMSVVEEARSICTLPIFAMSPCGSSFGLALDADGLVLPHFFSRKSEFPSVKEATNSSFGGAHKFPAKKMDGLEGSRWLV